MFSDRGWSGVWGVDLEFMYLNSKALGVINLMNSTTYTILGLLWAILVPLYSLWTHSNKTYLKLGVSKCLLPLRYSVPRMESTYSYPVNLSRMCCHCPFIKRRNSNDLPKVSCPSSGITLISCILDHSNGTTEPVISVKSSIPSFNLYHALHHLDHYTRIPETLSFRWRLQES
jgi:hypothetical protein